MARTPIAVSPPQPAGPPDASFDHANFYYRFEYAGPFTATIFSATTIGSGDMGAASLAYSGMVVRIIEGTGRGQERSIATNDQTTLTVSPGWSVLPDATSTFVVAEGSWKFGAVSATSPVQFEVSYHVGTVLQISGRGANVNNQEGTADLCPLTRWPLGGGQSDAGHSWCSRVSTECARRRKCNYFRHRICNTWITSPPFQVEPCRYSPGMSCSLRVAILWRWRSTTLPAASYSTK